MAERTRRLVVAALLFSCLLLRALIPVGYMPGNLLAGEFMTLCPQTMPGPAAHALHREHVESPPFAVDVQSACPIGSALLMAAPPPAEPAVLSLSYAAAQPMPAAADVAATPPVVRFRSRAPPRSGLFTTT